MDMWSLELMSEQLTTREPIAPTVVIAAEVGELADIAIYLRAPLSRRGK